MHALDIVVGEKIVTLGCNAYECDLSSENGIHAFARRFEDKPVDLLLNIAGTDQRPYDHFR